MGKNKLEHIVSCGSILFRDYVDINNDVEILLVKANKHSGWGIPKGKKNDPNSTEEEVAIREVYEETGIKINELGIFFCDINICRESRGYTKQIKVWLTKVPYDALEPAPIDTSEIESAAWFNINKLPTIIPYQRSVIERIVNNLRSVYGKEQ